MYSIDWPLRWPVSHLPAWAVPMTRRNVMMSGEEKYDRIKIGVAVLLVVLISVLHYSTGYREPYYHALNRELYFIPLILSGLWFGLRGALIASAGITSMYLPYTIMVWNNFAASDFERILSILLFNVIAATLGLVSDKQKASEAALRRSERLAAMGQAVSAVAHDIKTPLITIEGFVRLARKGLSEDDPVGEKLDIVIRETKRLENMVNEMLDFSRPLTLNRVPVDFTQPLREIISLVQDEAARMNVTIEEKLPEKLPEVALDPERIKEALLNLVINAVQASPEGEIVTLSVSMGTDSLLCDVIDRGHGIAAGTMEKIFSPFFTTKKGGTGLGLYIARRIIEAHGGKITVLKGREQGVIFRVSLPLSTGSRLLRAD